MSKDIDAKGSLTETEVIASLQTGDATLVLTFPRNDDAAVEDATSLVYEAEHAFSAVLEALVNKVNETEEV